jgi:glutamine synthetase
MNHIIPTVSKYQSLLIDNVHKLKDIFPGEKANKIAADNITIIEQISDHESFIIENVKKLIDQRREANKIENEREKAVAYHDRVVPYLESIRYHVDKLEQIVDDELWPLPKYRELLFIR